MKHTTNKFTLSSISLALLMAVTACGGEFSAEKAEKRLSPPPTAIDTPSFPGKRANYTITRTSTGIVVRDNVGGAGSTTVSGASSLKFADMTINLTIVNKANTIANKDLNSLIDLYIAFFNRVPDADGLAYWIDRFKSGMSLDQIAQSFYSAALLYSAQTGYSANMTNEDFVKIIYKNVLGRSGATAPPTADVQYWANELRGGRSKSSLISVMLISARSFANDATWGWVTTLLNNKVSIANYFAIEQGINYNSPEESITQTMAIVAAITSSGMEAARKQIGINDANTSANTPTNSADNGSSSSCFNPELYKNGTTYQVDMKSSWDGSVTSTKYKINENVNFRGISATEVQMDTNGGIDKSYVKIDSGALYSLGVITSLGRLNYFEPQLKTPISMEKNKAYTQSVTLKSESTGSSSSTGNTSMDQVLGTTFLGIEDITVGAGTFSACKFMNTATVFGQTNTSFHWAIASGRYRGIFIKQEFAGGITSQAMKLLLNGS